MLTVAFVSAVAFANAQTMTSKEGVSILPESGDWSISVDAAPLGTFFRDSGPSAFSNQYLQNMTIVGKMMTSANSAIRGKVRIGFGSTSQDAFSNTSGSTTNPPATVVDTKKSSEMNITLGAGIQKYRGKGRVQGYYGAEAYIMLGSDNTDYTYGNAISPTYQAPERANFGSNIVGPGTYATNDKSGSTFGFGVRGFIGAEYFFASKMSFGLEYGWGLGLGSTGEGETTVESFNATSGAASSATVKSGGSSSFGIDVDNASGSVFFSFYF